MPTALGTSTTCFASRLSPGSFRTPRRASPNCRPFGRARIPHRIAGLTTVGLFALLPIFVVLLQRYLFRTEIQVGPTDHLTIGYILIMVTFGTFLQYLRVLTGTVWTGIGFHLFFLMSNRIVGIQTSSFILMSDLTTQGPMQGVMAGSMLPVFGALLLYPRLSGRSLGWGEVDPE